MDEVVTVARIQQTEPEVPLHAAYAAFRATLVNLGFLALYLACASTPGPNTKFLQTQITRANTPALRHLTSPFHLY